MYDFIFITTGNPGKFIVRGATNGGGGSWSFTTLSSEYTDIQSAVDYFEGYLAAEASANQYSAGSQAFKDGFDAFTA